MAKGVSGSGHTQYWLSQQRRETTVGSKYHGTSAKAGGKMKGSGKSKKGC